MTGRSARQTVIQAGGAKLSTEGSGEEWRQQEGRWGRARPGARSGFPTHQELVGKAQAQHQPQHTGHQPEGHTQGRHPGEEKTLVLEDRLPRAKSQAGPPTHQHPNSPAPGHFLPPPQTTAYTQQRGSLRTVVQLPTPGTQGPWLHRL